jgi:hypothetical protein
MDRRALFFLGAAVACIALVPITPSDLRYVGVWLCIAYTLLAALSFLDDRSRRTR